MKVESLLLSKAARRTRRSSRRLSMKIKSFRNSSSGHCYHVQCTKNVLKLTIILHGLNYQSTYKPVGRSSLLSPTRCLCIHNRTDARPWCQYQPRGFPKKARDGSTSDDSGSAAGMTKRVCIFLLTSYFLLLTSRSCHPELVSGSCRANRFRLGGRNDKEGWHFFTCFLLLTPCFFFLWRKHVTAGSYR